MNLNNGVFTLSLDFELYWGVRDKRSIEQYQSNLEGVKNAVTEILKIFLEFELHATWATVGFLFFEDTATLKNNLPALKPSYQNPVLSPYRYIENNEIKENSYHFAPTLIRKIQAAPGQEIGTHTFSHYYCREPGQSVAEFEQDIKAAQNIALEFGIHLTSLVCPRNQVNTSYLSILKAHNIKCYRGNQSTWLYKPGGNVIRKYCNRAPRLADAYITLPGDNTYDLTSCREDGIYNFPASQFLRPCSKSLSILDRFRVAQIKASMTKAAINKKIYHLWWHPHNFGVNTDANIAVFREIAEHYASLKDEYEMKSLNMRELCRQFD